MLNSPGIESGSLPEIGYVLTQIDGTIQSLDVISNEQGIKSLTPLISKSHRLREKLLFADQGSIDKAISLYSDQGPVHSLLRIVVEDRAVQEWQLLGVTDQIDVLDEEISRSATFQRLEEKQRQFISRGGYEIVE